MTTTNTTATPNVTSAEPPTSPASYAAYRYQVVCVCNGIGFPISGSAKRVVNVGRALQAAGIDFSVLHCAATPVRLNTQRSGVYRGIRFQYLTSMKRPRNPVVRIPVYFWGLARLAFRLFRLRRERRRTAVYLFAMEGPLVVAAGVLCKLFGIPLVQEMNEWFPAAPHSKYVAWLYRGPIFAQATGVLAISTSIARRVTAIAATTNPRLIVHHLPSMVDSQVFVEAEPLTTPHVDPLPVFLWCGVGYPDDVLFLVRVLGRVLHQGYECRLRIMSANYVEWTPDSIREYARSQNVDLNAIEFTGPVDDRTQASYYKSATAHLLPMWDDDKSKTRFPNKLAEYLSSGRPVITSAIGDMVNSLVDGINAYLGRPGDEGDFANNMIAVMQDPARAARIGAAGQQTCIERMDFRSQTEGLGRMFADCIESRNAATKGRGV